MFKRKEKEKIDPSQLIDPNKSPRQIMKIRCEHCGQSNPPKKWAWKYIVGIAVLVGFGGIVGWLPLLIMNPYICENCDERDQLVKEYNDKSEVEIRAMRKTLFFIIAIPTLILAVFLFLIRASAY